MSARRIRPFTGRSPAGLSFIQRLAAAVVLALLFAQGAALTHAVAHARTQGLAAEAVAAQDVWGHDAGSSACHLLDHLLSGQAPGAQTAALDCPPPAPAQRAEVLKSFDTGPALRAYEARGPPRA
jgi:hypothetical protein